MRKLENLSYFALRVYLPLQVQLVSHVLSDFVDYNQLTESFQQWSKEDSDDEMSPEESSEPLFLGRCHNHDLQKHASVNQLAYHLGPIGRR